MKSKKITALLLLLIALVSTLHIAAAEVQPRRADEVFDSATVTLKSTKKASFDATTYGNQKTLAVTACWLEKKNGTKWVKQCNLETPAERNNTFSYLKEMDYSNKIGTGTYRIGATFDADGHSITRYSNSRTF